MSNSQRLSDEQLLELVNIAPVTLAVINPDNAAPRFAITSRHLVYEIQALRQTEKWLREEMDRQAARYGPVVEALREVVRCYGTNATQDEVAWAMDDAHEALAALDGGGKS